MSETVRVLVADDHPVVRFGMSALLGSLPGVEVVAEASTGADAIREAQLTRPDVLLMDLQMPTMDGIEATRRLATLLPDVAVLVVTMSDDDETVVSAMRAGARGYLLKGAEQGEILAAIQAVAAGHVVVAAQVAALLVEGPPSKRLIPGLTSRENEILDHLVQGHGNARIANDLGLAVKTVANHLSATYVKLGVVTRTEAIVKARELGHDPGVNP